MILVTIGQYGAVAVGVDHEDVAQYLESQRVVVRYAPWWEVEPYESWQTPLGNSHGTVSGITTYLIGRNTGPRLHSTTHAITNIPNIQALKTHLALIDGQRGRELTFPVTINITPRST